jgi:hypothetical protein
VSATGRSQGILTSPDSAYIASGNGGLLTLADAGPPMASAQDWQLYQ